MDNEPDKSASSPVTPAGSEGEVEALFLKLIDTLKPLAEVAEKLAHCHVVEICEPHPDNPSPNIVPMPREWFERAADDMEAIAILLHGAGTLSEGQASKITGLDRVEVRKLADALAALAQPPAGYEDGRPAGWTYSFDDGMGPRQYSVLNPPFPCASKSPPTKHHGSPITEVRAFYYAQPPAGEAVDLAAMREYAVTMTKKHGNPIGTDYEQGQNDMGYRWVHSFDDLPTAHPAEPAAPDGGERERVAKLTYDGDDMLVTAKALERWLQQYPPSTRQERSVEAANAALTAFCLHHQLAALRPAEGLGRLRAEDHGSSAAPIPTGSSSGVADQRSCTCHPSDNPPTPCPKRYALAECLAASEQAVAGEPDKSVRLCPQDRQPCPPGCDSDDLRHCAIEAERTPADTPSTGRGQNPQGKGAKG